MHLSRPSLPRLSHASTTPLPASPDPSRTMEAVAAPSLDSRSSRTASTMFPPWKWSPPVASEAMRRPEKLSLEQDGTKTWGRIYNHRKEIRRPTHLEVSIKRAELIRPNATLLLQDLCSRRTAKLRLLRTPCQKRIKPCHKRKITPCHMRITHITHVT